MVVFDARHARRMSPLLLRLVLDQIVERSPERIVKIARARAHHTVVGEVAIAAALVAERFGAKPMRAT
jgi:hypothetical protein